jgi:pimeloyl-ACP methyl ester carboxylesterase
MRRQGARIGPVLAALLATAFLATASRDAVSRAGECHSLLIGRKKVPYLCNHALTVADPAITRAVIIIHGGYRVPEEYYAPLLVALVANPDLERNWRRRTIVLAPHFQERDDAAGDEHWWKGNWREGGESDGLSSYAVVDTLIARLRNGTFPNLKWVVIAGHSAGGQFAQRYAAFTDVDLKPGPHAAQVKFVIANPSSYVYLNEYRRGKGAQPWIVPEPDCPVGDRTNEWKYGLDGLQGYVAARGAEFARTHFPRRNVEVLAGTEDELTGEGFDKDCAGMWQGATRFERAQNFKAFMDHFYPANHVKLTVVQGVGHSGPLMLGSPQGIRAIFFPD